MLRQLDILPLSEYKHKIVIVGAGGIGSPTALTIAKMGYKGDNILVVDDDKLEEHNIPNQFYKAFGQIDMSKVLALKSNIYEFTGTEVNIQQIKVESEKQLSGLSNTILISAVDNMKARKMCFKAIKYQFNSFLIDCRITYPYLILYCVKSTNKDQLSEFEKTLFDDKDAMEGKCTAQCTFYTSTMAASLIANLVRNIEMETDVPYSIKYCFDPIQFIITR